MRIEVVYSPAARRVERVELELPEGATVAEAVAASGLPRRHAELEAARGAPGGVGVWGQPCAPEQVLRDGDRVELYRALQVDPKEARRLRQRRQPEHGSRPEPAARPRRATPFSGS